MTTGSSPFSQVDQMQARPTFSPMPDTPLDPITETLRPVGGVAPDSQERQAERELVQREAKQKAADARNGAHAAGRHVHHGRSHHVHLQTKKLAHWQRAVKPVAGAAWERRAATLKPLTLTSVARNPTPAP